MVAPVEVGEGGIDLLVRNGLLKQHQTGDRKLVGAACLVALEQWSEGRAAQVRGMVTQIEAWAEFCLNDGTVFIKGGVAPGYINATANKQ